MHEENGHSYGILKFVFKYISANKFLIILKRFEYINLSLKNLSTEHGALTSHISMTT